MSGPSALGLAWLGFTSHHFSLSRSLALLARACTCRLVLSANLLQEWGHGGRERSVSVLTLGQLSTSILESVCCVSADYFATYKFQQYMAQTLVTSIRRPQTVCVSVCVCGCEEMWHAQNVKRDCCPDRQGVQAGGPGSQFVTA